MKKPRKPALDAFCFKLEMDRIIEAEDEEQARAILREEVGELADDFVLDDVVPHA